MRKIYSALSLWFSVVVIAVTLFTDRADAGTPVGFVLHTNNVAFCVLPPRGLTSIEAWETNRSVLAGAVYAVTGRTYVAQNAGTTTNTPTGTTLGGSEIGTDGIRWMRVDQVTSRRLGFQIQTTSTNAPVIALTIGNRPTAVGAGIQVACSNGTFSILSEAPQDPVYIFSVSTNTTIYAQDW